MKMEPGDTRAGDNGASMKQGAAISGTAHAVILALVLWGADFFSASDTVPLAATDVTIIDATEFMASLSTAPVVPSEGPADLSPPADPDSAPDAPAAEAEPDRTVPASSPPPRRPPSDEVPDIIVPPPAIDVPSEDVGSSIAEVAVPDEMPFEAPTPESPPSTEPVIATAPAPAELPAPAPEAPPLPEPEPAPVSEPEPEEAEPEAEAPAEIEAPPGPAPETAALPIAKPADLAAAARAAAAAAAAAEEEEATRTATTEPEPAPATPEPTTAPAAGSSRVQGPRLSLNEVRGLSVDVGRYFIYNGNRDPSLRLIVRVSFSEAGQVTDGPTLRSREGGDANAQNALFRAARSAIIRAAADGVFARLPREKYGSWRTIDFVVTPGGVQGTT